MFIVYLVLQPQGKLQIDGWYYPQPLLYICLHFPCASIAFISIIRAGLGCGYQWGEHRKGSVRCMLFQQRSHW